MGTLLEPRLAGQGVNGRFEDEVSSHVWRLLSGMCPNANPLERRQEQRFPYPRLIFLSPLGPDGQPRPGAPIAVAGKHLSERGLGFFHPQPLPHRLVIASLDQSDGGWLGFLLDVHRCRFTRHGWYESGGRFLKAVESPLSSRPPPAGRAPS
jgi:hypothetical protein